MKVKGQWPLRPFSWDCRCISITISIGIPLRYEESLVIREPGSLVGHLVSHLPTPNCSFILDLSESQRHAGFEDCDLPVAVLFVVSRDAACDTDDKPDKAFTKFLHAFALQKGAGIEVDPVRLAGI